MSHPHDLPWEDYEKTLQPHEKPQMLGSPATPDSVNSTLLRRSRAINFTGNRQISCIHNDGCFPWAARCLDFREPPKKEAQAAFRAAIF